MTAELEEDVARLRKEHAAADGVERSRTALLLGLAISDLVADLPSDDSRLPGLAEEGMLRLDEGAASAAPTWAAAIEQGKEVLEGKLRSPAAVHPPPAPAAATPTDRSRSPELPFALSWEKITNTYSGNFAGAVGMLRMVMEAVRPMTID
jgi:hypothetical protein